MVSCSHHHHLNKEHFHFHHHKKEFQSLLVPFSPWLLATINLLSASVDVPLLDIYLDGIIQSMAFCIWLLSLSMFSRFIHLVDECISTACISSLPISRPNNISLNSYTVLFYQFIIWWFYFLTFCIMLPWVLIYKILVDIYFGSFSYSADWVNRYHFGK